MNGYNRRRNNYGSSYCHRGIVRNLYLDNYFIASVIDILIGAAYEYIAGIPICLIATIIVLKIIKIAPTAALKTIPSASIQAASGIAKMLYPEAHQWKVTV